MTPKEKAEDLIYQMRYDHMDSTLTKKKAKRCAKIAVDEIVKNGLFTFSDLQYWEEVRTEIDAS